MPLRLHGDGAEFLTRDSLLSLSMTGLLATGSTKELTLNLASWPLSITAKLARHGHDSFLDIWKVLRWSFDALARGKHPTQNDKATPIPDMVSHPCRLGGLVVSICPNLGFSYPLRLCLPSLSPSISRSALGRHQCLGSAA